MCDSCFGCWNKLPKTQQLKTSHIRAHGLEVAGPSGFQAWNQDRVPQAALEGNLFTTFPGFWKWMSLCLWPPPPSSRPAVQHCPLCDSDLWPPSYKGLGDGVGPPWCPGSSPTSGSLTELFVSHTLCRFWGWDLDILGLLPPPA